MSTTQVQPAQVWLDLEAGYRTAGRERLLQVIAVPGRKALCRVISDTKTPPWPGFPQVTQISVHRMVGPAAYRRYRLVDQEPPVQPAAS